MLGNLVESKPQKSRRTTGTLFSFIAHYGLILCAIYTSAQATTVDDGPKQEEIDFIEPRKDEPPPQREPLLPEPVAPRPVKEFKVLITPVHIASKLPDIDVSQGITDPDAFVRKGSPTVPSQALLMMNNELVAEQARYWADRVCSVEPDPVRRIDRMYVEAFARPPEDWERRESLQFVDAHPKQRVVGWADLAHVLRQSTLQLRHAMSMDGGREAELVVTRAAFRYASFGQWSSEDEHPSSPAARVPLPAVISVELP